MGSFLSWRDAKFEGMMRRIYQKILERAKPFLGTRQNLTHTRIVLRYALKLLKEEKGNEEVVIPAVLLHDVGWDTIPEHLHLTAFGPNLSNPELAKVHEVEGTKIAKKILDALHYPPEKAKEICQIIRGHDTRNRSISRNDRIVKDSDKLFRYSRKGLAIDMDRFRTSRISRLNFLEKQVEEWFFLSASRQLARKELAQRRNEKNRD
jgi:HD superfamily phosphodiesterase